MSRLTHLDARGNAHMVDVSEKDVTSRIAVAKALVEMQPATLRLILEGKAKKGDVIGAARIAGIMAAKRTHELIPLCHPLALSKVELDIVPDTTLPGLQVRASVKVKGPTGVETWLSEEHALPMIAADELDVVPDLFQPPRRAARIVVEHADGVAGLHQRFHQCGADEARATRHEDVHGGGD